MAKSNWLALLVIAPSLNAMDQAYSNPPIVVQDLLKSRYTFCNFKEEFVEHSQDQAQVIACDQQNVYVGHASYNILNPSDFYLFIGAMFQKNDYIHAFVKILMDRTKEAQESSLTIRVHKDILPS
ncbi:MAG TPA: hypothetical protein VHA52_09120, partial [Candidatus Babeliaceae bacterium]|nr:hypothetical protein [Candidatus Babeliaceae bacterium]